MATVTLGGDRLGSGKKQKVHLHGYERSTHDQGYIWRSSMSAGTLVPFLVEIGLPGETKDIELDAHVLTLPTIGPLFGSYKLQIDVHVAPIRLYNGLLHNNALGIGKNMANVKLPQIRLTAMPSTPGAPPEDLNNSQINPSCILKYLGISGIGIHFEETPQTRDFNCTALLMYWDCYKNYYANKQEEIGAVIHTESQTVINTVTEIEVGLMGSGSTVLLPALPSVDTIPLTQGWQFLIEFSGATPQPQQIMIQTQELGIKSILDLCGGMEVISAGVARAVYNSTRWGNITANGWRMINSQDMFDGRPAVETFDLTNIDDMRNAILQQTSTSPFIISQSTNAIEPYVWLCQTPASRPNTLSNQEGLALKTYQSDIFNNWLSTEWIDGPGGINEITAIDTSGGSFDIDTLILSKKVYNMLNRIAVSGGSYRDWQEAVYDHPQYTGAESPMYMGGLIKEIIFQEVVSNSAQETTGGVQPLGTIAGKGTLAKKHKGGKVVIKIDEPSYVMGIVSITPRVDYSQGNRFDVGLQTLDDLHKPPLDAIGFQELITEKMTWWSTHFNGSTWVQLSAGKQPAWTDYMTNYNRTYGNFAIESQEMFMTLNRRYEHNEDYEMVDLTTYIDPSKFNFIFSNTSLDSQNFWVQIAVDITSRKKMSAKIMPNL